MTLDQIEMLEAIVVEGSMQKAAKKLYKSQPSLSVGIKKIEEFYGIKIFSRETYRPTLTKEGEVFYKNALPVLESHRRLHKIATELGSGVESEIRIAIDPLVEISKVNQFLSAALPHSATTSLSFIEGVLEGPMELLVQGDVEFAIGHCPPHRSHEVLKKKIEQLELIPVMKKGGNLNDLPNIVVSELSGSSEMPQTKDFSWHVTSHSRKEELILAGLGWGRMSQNKINTFKGTLTKIKSKEHLKASLDIYIMVKKQAPLGKVSQQMWKSL